MAWPIFGGTSVNLLVALCLTCYLSSSVVSTMEATRPVVTIPQGELEGIIMYANDSRKIYGFTGIPYAEPPLGDLRLDERHKLTTMLAFGNNWHVLWHETKVQGTGCTDPLEWDLWRQQWWNIVPPDKRDRKCNRRRGLFVFGSLYAEGIHRFFPILFLIP